MDVKLNPQVMNTKNLKKLMSFTFEYFSKDKASSQAMYVKKNPYAEANKQYVFVKKDSELEASKSNLYRTNDGQLLHIDTVFVANKSSDSISFFQEGSENNYQYNYSYSHVGNITTSIPENTPYEIESERRATVITGSTSSTVFESNQYSGTAYSSYSSNYMNYNFLVKNSCTE